MPKPPNILLLVTDQEQHYRWLPSLSLRAKSELLEHGTGFRQFNVHTTPCSPSRSTMYFGRHTQHTKMIANLGMPPFPELAEGLRSIGHMLRERGYYTAYKGKWHLSDVGEGSGLLYGPYPMTTHGLEPFGFSDYNFDGDPHGTTRTGFKFDRQIATDAIEWLERRGTDPPDDKPWLLAVNFVNPHDIMFFWAADDQPETRAERDFLGPLARAPAVPPYDKEWDEPLPLSFHDDLADKPWATRTYAKLVEQVYGRVSRTDEEAWRRLRSYYFNCIRDVDDQALEILRALKRLNLEDRTMVVYTSDHGDMAGAHGMRQKGPMLFRENISVPFIVRHPDVKGGRETDALASPVDIAPTLLGFAGATKAEIAEREPQLAGVDVGEAVADSAARTERDDRGILYSYGVTMYIDPEFVMKLVKTSRELNKGIFQRMMFRHAIRKNPLRKRGFFRGVFDGRHKFARYFRPDDHHLPRDWETLTERNDLELYDTQEDPEELKNLGADPGDHRGLLMRLATRVNDLLEKEVGDDKGGEHVGPRFLDRRLRR